MSELTFRERATKGFAWNYVYKLAEFGLVNLYTILVVRHFGPSVSSPYAFFTALTTTLALVSAFAVDGVLLRYIQRIQPSKAQQISGYDELERSGLRTFLGTLFAFRILVVIGISILLVFVITVIPLFFPSVGIALHAVTVILPYLIIYLFAQAIVAFSTLSLVGLLETKNVFFASLIARILLVLGGLFLVYRDMLTLDHAMLLYISSTVLNAVFLLIALLREIRKKDPSGRMHKRLPIVSFIKRIWEMISHPKHIRLFLATPLMMYGITTWGSDVLSTVLGRQPDIIMMRAMLGEYSSEIGYYLSASIVLLVTEYIFLFGLGGTLVSIFSKLAHDDESEGSIQFPRLARARKEIAGLQNMAVLPLCVYVMIFAPDIIRAIYGANYAPAIPLIRTGIAALALAVGAFGGGMQITSLVAIGKQRLVFRNRLAWGIVNLAANFFLIMFYGGFGAMIGTQFANAFACGTESFFASRFIGQSVYLFGALRIGLFSAIAGIIAMYLVSLLNSPQAYILRASAGFFSAGGVLIVLCYLFKVPEAKLLWNRIQTFLTSSRRRVLVHE